MTGELATEEELAARRRAAAAAAAEDTRTPLEKLLDAHDDLDDDTLAEKISSLPADLTGVLLALWRRVQGGVADADGLVNPVTEPEPEPEPEPPAGAHAAPVA
jgi:hypothetical protein